jgi:hypothetical protein
MAPKSILKTKSSSHAGPSSSSRGGSGGGRDIERNTKMNAGSKFQKSLQVERTKGGRAGNGGPANGKGKGKAQAQAQGRRGKDGDVNEDYVSDEGESSDGFGGAGAEDVEMSDDGSVDTDEEIARGGAGGEKKKGTSEWIRLFPTSDGRGLVGWECTHGRTETHGDHGRDVRIDVDLAPGRADYKAQEVEEGRRDD